MKTILISSVVAVSLSLAGFSFAQSIPNPADNPDAGKPVKECYKNKKLKKNRVVWNGLCYVKPVCDDGYYYGPSMGSCMQDNGGGE